CRGIYGHFNLFIGHKSCKLHTAEQEMVFFLAIAENTDVMRSRLHPYGCIVIYLHQHGNTCLDLDATVTCKCRVA
ncbi:hypothetical protein ACJX0J_023158, partial [Zea mays]